MDLISRRALPIYANMESRRRKRCVDSEDEGKNSPGNKQPDRGSEGDGGGRRSQEFLTAQYAISDRSLGHWKQQYH